MAKLVAYVDELVQEVGPRPAGTQQEHQAAELIASRLDELGLNVEIEEFSCARNIGWVRLLYYGLCVLGTAVMIFSPGMHIVGAVAIILGAILMILDHLDKNPLSSLISTSLSQNVIARYLPDAADMGSRPKKIVILAHYDSARNMLQAMPSIVQHYSLLQKLVRYAVFALMVLAILLLIPFPAIVITIISIVAGVVSLAVLIPFIAEIVNFFLPYNQGANVNGSSIGVLYGLAQALTFGGDGMGARAADRSARDRRGYREDRGSGRDFDERGRSERGSERSGERSGERGSERRSSRGSGEYGSADLAGLTGAAAGGAAVGAAAGAVAGAGAISHGQVSAATVGSRPFEDRAARDPRVAQDMQELNAMMATAADGAASARNAGQAKDDAAGRDASIAHGPQVSPAMIEANKANLTDNMHKIPEGAVVNVEDNPYVKTRARAAEAAKQEALTEAERASSLDSFRAEQEEELRRLSEARQSQQRGRADRDEVPREPGTKPDWFLQAKQNAEKKLSGGEAGGAKATADEAEAQRSQFADMPLNSRPAAAAATAQAGEASAVRANVQRSQFADVEARVNVQRSQFADIEPRAKARAEENAAAMEAADAELAASADRAKDGQSAEAGEAGGAQAQASTQAGGQQAQAMPQAGGKPAEQPIAQRSGMQAAPSPQQLEAQAAQQAQAAQAAQAAQRAAAQAVQTAPSPEQMQGAATAQPTTAQLIAEQANNTIPHSMMSEIPSSNAGGEPARTVTPLTMDPDFSGLDRQAFKVLPGEEQSASVIVPTEASELDRTGRADARAEGAPRTLEGLGASLGRLGAQAQQPQAPAYPQAQVPAQQQAYPQAHPQAAGAITGAAFAPQGQPAEFAGAGVGTGTAPQAAQSLRSRLRNLPSLSMEASGSIPVQQANLDVEVVAKEDIFQQEDSPVSATGAFVPLGTTGVMRPVGADLLSEYSAAGDIYVDDADDSMAEKYTDSGQYSEPELVQIPRSRMKSFLGSVGERLGGKKKERLDTSAASWLGVDERFDARKEGHEIGTWDNFGNTDGNDKWSGGAYGGDSYSENLGAMMQGSSILLDKEVWLVALGANESKNVGLKNLFANHGNELKNALFINLMGVGVGDLVFTVSEGNFRPIQTDHRMQNLVSSAAQEMAIPIGPVNFDVFNTDGTEALKQGGRAISIMGLGKNVPVGWRWTDDEVGRLKEDNLLDTVELVLEVIKNS